MLLVPPMTIVFLIPKLLINLSVNLAKKTGLSTGYTFVTNGFKEADTIVGGVSFDRLSPFVSR
jgi:hypothetical protein